LIINIKKPFSVKEKGFLVFETFKIIIKVSKTTLMILKAPFGAFLVLVAFLKIFEKKKIIS